MPSGFKIPIKWKFFALLLALISFALIFIIMRTNKIFREDKEAFVRELNAKLTASTSHNFLNRITTLQDKLVIFISSRESLAHTGARIDDQLRVLFSRYQEFDAVAFLSTERNGALKVDWTLRNPRGEAAKWPSDYETSFLTTLNTKAAANNGRAFWRAQAPDGSWLVVLGFSVQVLDVMKSKGASQAKKTAWVVGVLPSNAFDELLSDFATGIATGFVVDDQGVAVATSDGSFRWKNIKEQPIVADILTNSKPAGTGDFIDGSGRAVVGSYEAIPKTNLTAVVTTPRDKAFEAADEMAHNIMAIGILIMVLAVGAAIIFSNYITAPLQKLAAIAAQVGAGNFKVPVDVSTNDEIGDLAASMAKMEQGLVERDEALASAQGALIQSEKMSAFGQLSAGIAHEVKNPLAGILGHAQLAMGKAGSDDLKKHLEVIEKETRRCKTIVENLMKFARAEKAELKPTDLAQVAQDTINLVDHQLSLAGCKIYKDFRAAPMVDANANQLQQVLLNLMVNASHAMETCPTKNVTVRVLQVGTKSQIQIEDTGAGIPPEIQKKIFEPFFTTKPAGKGTGLGLSVSIGIVKDHKGEIYLKSEQGKGTTFFIDFPIPDGAKVSDKPLENTHGGLVAAAPASAPTPTPVPSTGPEPAPSGAPSVGGAPATETDLTTPEKKVSEPKTSETKVHGVDHIFSAYREEQEKIKNIKSTSQMTGVEYKSDKKSDEVKNLPSKVSDSKPDVKSLTKNDKKSRKHDRKSEKKASIASLARQSEAPKDMKGETLGGKKPIDEKTTNMPDLPPEISDEILFGETAVTAVTLITASGPATAVTTGTAVASPDTSKADAANSEEFKVKIKRPKLKV